MTILREASCIMLSWADHHLHLYPCQRWYQVSRCCAISDLTSDHICHHHRWRWLWDMMDCHCRFYVVGGGKTWNELNFIVEQQESSETIIFHVNQDINSSLARWCVSICGVYKSKRLLIVTHKLAVYQIKTTTKPFFSINQFDTVAASAHVNQQNVLNKLVCLLCNYFWVKRILCIQKVNDSEAHV